ncbi:hypothetical protein QCE62_28900 [Caballeronia sp. LZ033]|uniref:hypothetical protein n=1 Tax=Caballeronia sp. LZ033 TaxID=3038566 RepID=UPI002866F9F7|nr:hypothetical protein [Caballeronia sp. LZ033]MDR5817632.1 hypothetical protein [Caballeronia sp. LZ033]
MSCNQPPCNTCLTRDCRTCAWTARFDAAKRAPATEVFITLTVTRREARRTWSSWLRMHARRLLALFRR